MTGKEIFINTNQSTSRLLLYNRNNSTPMLFLHGFTGTADSWEEVIRRIDTYAIAIDIVGHGGSIFKDLDLDYSVNDWCDDLSEILNSLNIHRLNICGYSMGGRLATAFAARHPEKIKQLILESASLGIEEGEAKKKRFDEDLELSRSIESDLKNFIQRWEDIPLFLNQKKRNQTEFLRQREQRHSHSPMQLSKALRTFSQGTIKSYESEFSEFTFPVSIVNGEEDRKYLKIGATICQLNRNCSQHTIKAGHNVHLENPKDFANTLEKVLNSSL